MQQKEKSIVIDRELRKLQARCIRSGYNTSQVEKFAACFFQAAAKTKRERWAKVALIVAVVLLIFFLLLQFQSPYKAAAALLRAGMIKLLTVWDWTQTYHSQCLLSNPLYRTADGLAVEDCQICEGLHSIQHVHNVDPGVAVAQWFSRDVPLIVDDGLRDWMDVAVTSPRDVALLYETDKALSSERSCGFTSNIRDKHGGGHMSLLRDIITRNISNYFAHWENCRIPAAKAFRAAFKRPYFLPPTVEISATNWVFISSNYTGALFKQVDVDHPLVMLLQVSGQSEVQVKAWSPCTDLCPVLKDTLHAGQVLITTEFLWKTSYLPVSNNDNFAIGLGGSF